MVTNGVVRCAKLQSKCHHQQINTQFFYRQGALRVAEPTVSKPIMNRIQTRLLSTTFLLHVLFSRRVIKVGWYITALSVQIRYIMP